MFQMNLDKSLSFSLEIIGLGLIMVILFFNINPLVNLDEAEKLYYQAKSLDARGKTEQALKAIDQAIKLNPQLGKAYLVKGKLIMQRDYSKYYAEGAFRKALDLPLDRENRARTFYNLGVFYLKHTFNQYSVFRAIPEFKKTIETGSSYFDDAFDPHGALVECYIKIGEYDKALRFAQEGIKINPQSAKRNFYLAEALYYLGDKESAKQVVENQIKRQDQQLADKFYSEFAF